MQINEHRRLVECDGHRHAVKRGKRGRFHFENLPWAKPLLKLLLKLTLTEGWGRRNALGVRGEHIELEFKNLPAAFDGTVILFISDLHIEAIEGLDTKVIEAVGSNHYDMCILGGDYSLDHGDKNKKAQVLIERIVDSIKTRSDVFAVLGNHDRFSMAQALASFGVKVLNNDNVCLEKGGERIYIVGVDDCHYFGADDLESAVGGIESDAFKILVSHSPEIYKSADDHGIDLLLSGHTHGGQICLPNGAVVVEGASVPYKIAKGKWVYNGLTGYTSRGAGSSCVPARFFCPPEVSFITLKKV